MKFKFDEDVEYYPSKKQNHYVKKQINELTEQQIENIANDLVNKKVDHRKIFGYIAEKDDTQYFVKWDKESEVCIYYNVINNELKIIKSLVKSFRDFNGEKLDEYYDELE